MTCVFLSPHSCRVRGSREQNPLDVEVGERLPHKPSRKESCGSTCDRCTTFSLLSVGLRNWRSNAISRSDEMMQRRRVLVGMLNDIILNMLHVLTGACVRRSLTEPRGRQGFSLVSLEEFDSWPKAIKFARWKMGLSIHLVSPRDAFPAAGPQPCHTAHP